MIFFLLHSILCEEEIISEGTYGKSQNWLPLIEPNRVHARLVLFDYPDKRVPIKRFMRTSIGFTSLKENYVFQELIGHVIDPKDQTHYIWNLTSFGTTGRVSTEDTITHMHYCQLDTDMIPGTYFVDFYAQLLDENNINHSILVFNDSLTFYSVIDYKYQIGSVVLYGFFASLLLFIVYFIFSKDKVKKPTTTRSTKPKVRDYSEIHSRSASPSSDEACPKSPLNGPRNTSPKKF